MVAAGALAATAVLLGGALRGSHSSGAQAAPAAAARSGDAVGENGFATGNTAAMVSDLQVQLRANPRDAHGYALLGLAYQQRARETGDPTYYTKSDGALHRALALSPGDLLATGGLGSLALSRHHFREALALGRQTLRLSPGTARTYGVIGDALIELGRYREAFRAFDTMARLKPSLAAYARVSYARELLGRPRAAIPAMRLAVDAAADQPEATAWSRVQLGKLYWSTGRLKQAAQQYRGALAAFPGYVYALDALAQVEGARGRLGRAIARSSRPRAASTCASASSAYT